MPASEATPLDVALNLSELLKKSLADKTSMQMCLFK